MNRFLSIVSLRVMQLSLVALMVMGWTTCESREKPFEEVTYQKFVSKLYTKTITFNELVKNALDEFDISEDGIMAPYVGDAQKLLSLNIRYDVHAITYHTVTPDGKPTIASGVIYYPRTFSPKGVLEISPITKSKKQCGSINYSIPEAVPGMVGYISIMPDLIGYGSTEELPISYLQHDNIARVSADMRQAAAEFIYNHYHHEMSRESILFGYSLGGSGILALARYYEKNPSVGVVVRDLYLGAGAYFPDLVIDELSKTRRSDYAAVPNILWSINYYAHLNLNFDNLFVGKLAEHYSEWCTGYKPIFDLTKELGTDMNNYISKDFLDHIDDPKYAPLMDAFKQLNIPLDWVPKARIHLYQAAEDHYVPSAGSDKLYDYFKSVGAKVEYKRYDDLSHIEVGAMLWIELTKKLAKKIRLL